MLKKEYAKYVIPSVIAFILTGFYAIVDGFFVGRKLGDPGLAAINVAYPIFAIFQAIGTGIGMGGAIQFSLTQDQKKKMNIIFICNLLFLIASALILLIFSLSGEYLIKAQGGDARTNELGTKYLQVCVFGCILQVFSTGLVPLMRNYGGSLIAMIFMVSGCITNIILDYLFIWVLDYGVVGAAVATLAGQAVSVVLIFSFLAYKKVNFFKHIDKEAFKNIFPILKSSISPIGNTYSPLFTLILLNLYTTRFSQDALSCYSTIAYITFIIQSMLQGVGDGTQPLYSKYYGLGEFDSVKKLRRYSFITVIALSIFSMILISLLNNLLPKAFGNSPQVIEMFSKAIFFFIAGFMFLGITRCSISYFYAIDKRKEANFITYLEPFTLLIILALTSSILKLDGVWLAVPVTQFITACVSVTMLFTTKKENAPKVTLKRS